MKGSMKSYQVREMTSSSASTVSVQKEAGVAGLAELGLDDGEGLVGELGEQHGLDFGLEPAGQGDVVGVDPNFIVYDGRS